MSIYTDRRSGSTFIQFEFGGRVYKKYLSGTRKDLKEYETNWRNFLAQTENVAAEANYVYLFRLGKFHKIGVSGNVEKRRLHLSHNMPFEVEIVSFFEARFARRLERQFHVRFRDKRVKGEWFDLNDEDVEYFKRVANGSVSVFDA